MDIDIDTNQQLRAPLPKVYFTRSLDYQKWYGVRYRIRQFDNFTIQYVASRIRNPCALRY